MSFCQAGDTARVTFPDESTQDFTDTPITITCKKIFPPCRLVRIFFNLRMRNGGVYSSYTELNAPPDGEFKCRIVPEYPPGYGVDNSRLEIYGGYLSCTPAWYKIKHAVGDRTFISCELFYDDAAPASQLLQVIGNSGLTLFSGAFDSCSYSVVCLRCPPNTLECGDCCLPCSIIFNQLSAIRAQLARLK